METICWKHPDGNLLLDTRGGYFEEVILVKDYGIVLRFKVMGPGALVKHPGIANLSITIA